MPSVKKCSTLLKEIYLINLRENTNYITLMLSGSHGIGKSTVIRTAAADMGGLCLTLELSSAKEGDISGLPFPFKNDDGTQEVRFIKHNVFNTVYRLERHYYDIATKEGFLNGSLKLITEENGDDYYVYDGKKTLIRTALNKIEDGEENVYKFFDYLPSDLKIKLIESGEIRPVFIMFDELNRADNFTMKEGMNTILNRMVNGYKLPGFSNIVAAINPSSQNSSYATQELDPAQMSRMLLLKVNAKVDEWVDYALDAGLDSDVVEAIAVSNEIFNQKDSSTEDTTEMTPDPRAWEMVSLIISNKDILMNSKFLSSEEKKTIEDDVRTLVYGKVGQTAGRTLFQNMANKENNIKPTEILTMKDIHIDPKIVQKFNRQTSLTKTIIATNVVRYLDTNINDIVKMKTSSDANKKKTYMNFFEQLKEFVNILDSSTQILFAKKVIKTGKLYNKVSGIFAKDILVNLNIAKDALNNLQNDD